MSKVKTCTDTFGFSELPLFDKIRKTLPDDITQTLNIIECKEDVVFAWSAADSCVLTLNWRAAKSKTDGSVKFQTLLPSTPVDFAIEKITVSHEGSFLALSGRQGVAVLELPRRWGPNGQYKEGKESILCSSYNLDKRFFSHSPLVQVLQVRWHPESPKDCNLLVLLSDNTIRVYDEGLLKHVWPIGVKIPTTGADLTMLNDLGDTAVDFAFGPRRIAAIDSKESDLNISSLSINDNTRNLSHIINTERKDNLSSVEWPLLILRGNGSVYVALIGINSEKPLIQGPLTMIPSTRDNYGINACSILVLPSTPATVVIADPSGKLYHAIMLNTTEQHNRSITDIDSTLNIQPSEWRLHVLEMIELDCWLPETENSKFHCSPIYLKLDINNECRYFAYHNAGLHAVSVNFTKELELFFCEENDNSSDVALQIPSHVEYLVCTKALNNTKANPVLGFTLLQSPSGLLLLLASGQVVSLNVITNPSYLRNMLDSNTDASKSKIDSSQINKLFSEPFDSHIRKILADRSSQPLLKLDKSQGISVKESIELFVYATDVLREQYIIKHDKVKQEIEKRVRILQLLKQQQEQEIGQLENDKVQIRNDAERLAELYEEINDRQQVLFKRCQEIIRLINVKIPRGATAEKNYAIQLERLELATKSLANSLLLAKKKVEQQKEQINSVEESNKTKVVLQPRQETALKEIISEINTEIETQVKDLRGIKSVLNI